MIGHHSLQLSRPKESFIPQAGPTYFRSFTFLPIKIGNNSHTHYHFHQHHSPYPIIHNSPYPTIPSLPPTSTENSNPLSLILHQSHHPSELAPEMTSIKLLSPPGIGESLRDSHRFSQVAKLDNVYETAGQSPPPSPPFPPPTDLPPSPQPPSAPTAPSPPSSAHKSSKSSKTCKPS